MKKQTSLKETENFMLKGHYKALRKSLDVCFSLPLLLQLSAEV